MAFLLSCCALNLCECAGCMACSCFGKLVNATMAQSARLGHFLIIVTTFGLAIGLGKHYPSEINGYSTSHLQVTLQADCADNFLNDCIYHQLIYRASFALFLLYFIMAVSSTCSEYVNRSFWVIKFVFAIGLFVALWWGSNSFFSGWAELARVVSFLWLLVQGLLFLDFAHDCHDLIMGNADEAERNNQGSSSWYFTYLFFSAGSLVCAIVGLVYLFQNYAGCSLGMFFTVLTLLLGVITTFLSLLNVVNKGLLTPCIMFGYSVFMTWYALMSNPDDTCNPNADQPDGNNENVIAVVVVSVISCCIVLYCVVYGTAILNIFNPNAESGVMAAPTNSAFKAVVTGEVSGTGGDHVGTVATQNQPEPENVSGTSHERVFYHVLMMLVSCYGAMILTNWGDVNGSTANDSHRSANESMWLKITAQWLFVALYLKVLQVAYSERQT